MSVSFGVNVSWDEARRHVHTAIYFGNDYLSLLDRSELFICTKLNVARSPMPCADGMILFLMTIL